MRECDLEGVGDGGPGEVSVAISGDGSIVCMGYWGRSCMGTVSGDLCAAGSESYLTRKDLNSKAPG